MTRKRLWKRLGLSALALVLAWLAISAFVTWKLTRRERPRRPEPVPAIAWGTIEEHRLRTGDGELIGAWLVRGTRPVTVILLHGNGGSRSTMVPEMEVIHREGYSVLALTLRAHGDSSGSVNDVGYSARHDVREAVRFAREKLPGNAVAVVAHSLGAAAAIFSAADCAPNVRGYLLIAPYRDLNTAVWNRCSMYLFHPFSDLAYWGLRLWAPAMLPESPALISPVDHIAEIPASVPVVLLASREDRHARLWEAQELCNRIASHATLVETGGRHENAFSEHREDYLRALRELMRQVK